MSESAYRDSCESLRSLLSSLQARAAELGARVDRVFLGRVDRRALDAIDEKWVTAGQAAWRAETFKALSRAVDLHRDLVSYLESVEAREAEYRAVDEELLIGDKPRRKTQWVLALVALAIIPINFFVYIATFKGGEESVLFVVLALLQLFCGVAAFIATSRVRHRGGGTMSIGVLGFLVGLGGPIGIALGWFVPALGALGGAWGRPLRLRGRVLHPELREGSDWTRGAKPDARDLDAPTRDALEALWLHDAQKEHASVPALARVSWLLAAVGAPADLTEAVHVAALEEVEHARLCFALAAGYGGRSHTVEPMPGLVVGGLDLGGDPLVRIAVESLNDGCLLEDFNADVAAACARECRERAVLDVLERVAREERSHAELSWRLLTFALERGGPRVARAIDRALDAIERVARPTAASDVTGPLVALADADAMRRHGRLTDAEWGEAWRTRVAATRLRARALVASSGRASASASSTSLGSQSLS